MKMIISLFALLCASVAASAQQPAPSPNQPALQRRCCLRRSTKRITTTVPTATPRPATEASTDFFVGEAKVDVTKDETVVKLAMAQHGSVLIELPANDGPRYIIPGDPEMATVDEKALERNKRAIVVRPGSLFVAPAPNRKVRTPAATVTAQMRSGLVVTFLFYPVEDLAQNVHRCVLSYNRDEVVARRRAAGLPVNLDTTSQERRNETGQSTAPTSISVEATEESKPDTETSAKSAGLVKSESDAKPKAEVKNKTPPLSATSDAARLNSKKTNEANERVNAIARDALTRAIKKPKQFKAWTKPAHGLALSIVRQPDPKDDLKLVIVAVRNTSTESLKLVSGSPDLLVEMLDDQGKSINIESIKKLHTEVSEATDAIPAGATVYYAIAYVSPVLGVHQQVKVVVGQTNAADEPASIALANGER
jgi:hypothetical protein